jgi:hypothetical protein
MKLILHTAAQREIIRAMIENRMTELMARCETISKLDLTDIQPKQRTGFEELIAEYRDQYSELDGIHRQF